MSSAVYSKQNLESTSKSSQLSRRNRLGREYAVNHALLIVTTDTCFSVTCSASSQNSESLANKYPAQHGSLRSPCVSSPAGGTAALARPRTQVGHMLHTLLPHSFENSVTWLQALVEVRAPSGDLEPSDEALLVEGGPPSLCLRTWLFCSCSFPRSCFFCIK